MIAVSTPETINPVADACEAAGVPCLSTVMPWQAWYFGRGAKPGQPSPFKWTYHFGFGVGEFFQTYVSQWTLIETNKKVGVLYPERRGRQRHPGQPRAVADQTGLSRSSIPVLTRMGQPITRPRFRSFQEGESARSSTPSRSRRTSRRSGGRPPSRATRKLVKICQVAKTGLFPDGIVALGALGENISSAAYWHKSFPYKSSLTGVSGQELADGYEKAAGKQWTQQLGASLAALDAATAALTASLDPKNKAAVAKALSVLNTVTIAGKVDFTSGPVPNVASGPIIGTQWVKAPKDSRFKLDYIVTENVTDPNVPVGGKLAGVQSEMSDAAILSATADRIAASLISD